MARYLRIAAAVFFALLAVAFVALWVRSYEWLDRTIYAHGDWLVGCYSNRGVVLAWSDFKGFDRAPMWSVDSTRIQQGSMTVESWTAKTMLGFGLYDDDNTTGVYLPHWFLAASSLALATLFAFKRTLRFTTRGLLIVTTIVAAILGLAVYAI